MTAAGAILYYMDFTEHKNTGHIRSLSRIDEDKYVWIDRFTIRNLELFATGYAHGRSFFQTLDRTRSPMGARTLHRWISLPLKDPAEINDRLDVTSLFIKDTELNERFSELIGNIGDMERINSKICAFRVLPREIVQLKNALVCCSRIREAALDSGCDPLVRWAEAIDPCEAMVSKIETTLFPDPSNQLQKGGVIADGVDIELDDLRKIANHGKDVLNDILERESARTGISSLKIGFNNVFGYYLEVTHTHKEKVPADWNRRQTLVNAERYITEELKDYEQKILGAEEKIVAIETGIYNDLVEELRAFAPRIQRNAAVIARLDCLLSFAEIAVERKYCRPEISQRNVIDIKEGRHPVIETVLPLGDAYIPNNVYLDDEMQQIMMITGPNMSGKSALLRQTALIVLMAQIGCYVPALSAEIGIVDKIFTRVGASDNISQGESTFMVEMLESASILNNVSNRSLILLDEIGRGTSTYDGISIAWAMVEYLHEHPTAKAKTLFATHYHELNRMEDLYHRIKNYHVSVKEVDKTVVFLRKLARGGTEHSFGIHVAKMAGMPGSVIKRADKILKDLEANQRTGVVDTGEGLPKPPKPGDLQLSIFQLEDPVLKQIRDQIRDLDPDRLTPIEALNKLNEIKKISGL